MQRTGNKLDVVKMVSKGKYILLDVTHTKWCDTTNATATCIACIARKMTPIARTSHKKTQTTEMGVAKRVRSI
jgi:hypothetical protein